MADLGEMPIPAWARDGVRLSGNTLALAGLELLPLPPEQSYILRLTATGQS
jgi:hypothetical protein